MTSNLYLANFSDEDVYSMLYHYHVKGDSLEELQLQLQFSIEHEAVQGFVEGWYRKECYTSFKTVEEILKGEH